MMWSPAIVAAVLGLVSPVLGSTIVKINALGDSITGSPGCWRALLWQKLQAADVTNTDFVGTLPPQGCGFTYDGDNDGHGGYLATGIVSNNNLPGWLNYSNPDVVMMFLGTNDVWSGIATAKITAAYTTLVGQMRAQNPKMVVMVAKITPMNPTSSPCTTCEAGVEALNAAIPAWAAGISTSTSPVSVVDCWTGYNDTLDTGDGVHPNDAGNTMLANDWYAPLSSVIVSVGGTVAATTTAVSTSSTSTTLVTTTTSKGTTTTTMTSSATATATATGVSPIWGQCAGNGWTGPTVCATGSTCTYNNAWYSQCLPS